MSASESVEPALITATEFAKRLNISIRSLWRLKSAGRLPPPIQLGGAIRWRLEQVVQWIASGCPADQSR